MSTVGEASEEIRGPVLAPDAPAELGGVVVDCPAGDASGELEHGAEPLADALGGLATEGLGGPNAGAREGDGGAPAPVDHAANPEIRLLEVHLGLAGQPARGQVALGVPRGRAPVGARRTRARHRGARLPRGRAGGPRGRAGGQRQRVLRRGGPGRRSRRAPGQGAPLLLRPAPPGPEGRVRAEPLRAAEDPADGRVLLRWAHPRGLRPRDGRGQLGAAREAGAADPARDVPERLRVPRRDVPERLRVPRRDAARRAGRRGDRRGRARPDAEVPGAREGRRGQGRVAARTRVALERPARVSAGTARARLRPEPNGTQRMAPRPAARLPMRPLGDVRIAVGTQDEVMCLEENRNQPLLSMMFSI